MSTLGIQDQEFNYVECRDVEILVAEMKKYIKNAKLIDEVKKAYYYAEEKHKDQKRKSGDPFIIHPLSTGYYLAQWRMGPKTIIAGLLHDVIEDTPVTFSEIEELYGVEVADIVEAVTKVSYFTKENREQMKANYLRKLFLSMIRDIRVIIVKIADRMHNLLTLEYMKPEKQKIIAKETLEIYSTIAHRIGMKTAKNILEDYSFEYLNPKEYSRVKSLLEEDKTSRKEIIDDIIEEINKKLKDGGIKNAQVFGRSKTIYSIYRKLTQFGKSFSDINDILAIRIITDKQDDCYRILGWLHELFTPLSGRFKDYIATPKNNLYQSLHSTLASKDGIIFEVQIRTKEMDEIAENGAAAHWKYKEGEKTVDIAEKQKEIDLKVDMFTRLMNLEKLATESIEIDYKEESEKLDLSGEVVEETFKSDYLSPMIYILTPDGSVVNLPFGSTVLDFAYKIHTEIGSKTVGAKINGVFSPYNTTLNSGEMVEIQTSKDTNPHEKWLRFVRTTTARRAIEDYLNAEKAKEAEKEKITNQKIIRNVKREIDRYIIANNLKWNVNSLDEIQKKLSVLDYKNIDEFLLSVGNGDFSVPEAVEIVYVSKQELKDIEVINDMKTRKYKSAKGRDDLRINGIEKVSCSLAQCCYPVPIEPVTSFMSKTKGIQVHRSDCLNITNIKKVKNLLETEWIEKKTNNKKYNVKIRISAYDRPGILLDIFTVFATQRVNLTEVKVISQEDDYTGKGSMIISVSDLDQLNIIIKTISEIPGVIAVARASSSESPIN
ncbi:bifunctional (p)ppGpp synthetase/guanosine-3',5'-bis(diphosphate) 3'-pyrophosphohydrolase [Spiroplasma sp. BIUS-1]|uniref:RelA/SpoT family protein n=1 Tax=Spiroplasma sp. BIUS-1 TaxID=216964 RepID=UPI0013975722|nr:RelA/SpoT family protein [Spiroplasma sp. BIUS-1]QHX36613.1 GTP pyrophosphokinase [Spiroplasma sp. BIUS-1]